MIMNNIEQQVKKANKDFYDIVGSSYEEIDGRRSEQLINYVVDQLDMLSKSTDADSILDLGCGSGFISRIAKDYFKKRYAVDISFQIVNAIDDDTILKFTADVDSIPIRNEKISSVVTFAVLHHCYSYDKMLIEIYRILKTDGIFYSDHDMDSIFFKRFEPLLKLYRMINNASKRYLSKFNELSKQVYHCSEYHQNGINSKEIENILKTIGFSDVRFQYHWYGLSPLTDKIFGKKTYKRGYAPLVKIIAVK
jgi:ubiquinone/menaquinone biosynthesis C-methylase UbiE